MPDFRVGESCRLACVLIFLGSLCCRTNAAPALVPEQSQAHSDAFKKSVGKNRTQQWRAVQPAFTNALAQTKKDKEAIAKLCEAWLGTSDKEAIEEATGMVQSPLSPQPIRGDVFAYLLSNEEGFRNFLYVDFRNPTKPQVGLFTSYEPPRKQDAHDLITEQEKQVARQLGATEINLGGGSLDGSYKSGFWIRLAGPQITAARMDNLTKLSTLVSLDLSGKELDDKLLSRIASHPYLASLGLKSTSVSDEGLMQLKQAKTLKFLTIEGTSISEKAIQELQKSLPQLEVELQGKTFRPRK